MYNKLQSKALIIITLHLNKVKSVFKFQVSSFKFQVLFVTYTTIQRLYNQQWNESRVRSMDSANIEKKQHKGSKHKIKWMKNKI